ncbi:MAG: phage major capsid protein family [Firmicutes bacterium]|nr:phage major capsid protein family [Bacillota bacterium]
MAQMTIEDVKALIKDTVSATLADNWEARLAKAEEASRNFSPQILASQMAQQAPPAEKGVKAARFLRALASAKGDPDRAARIAKEQWHDEAVAKALGESTVSGGGALVPEEYASEVIDLLRAKAVVRAMGTPSAPMNSGSLTMPFLSAGSTASYVGENQNISKSEPQTGNLQLSAKKLAALVPISNDLLRDASPNADTIVRNDMVRNMALREDLAFIRDNGSQYTPRGMRYWADPNQVFARTKAGATSTLAEVTFDLGKAVRLLEEANVALDRGGWIMTPRTKWYLMSLRDLNGNLVYEPEMRLGSLLTYPYRTTTQVPNNLGSGGDSEVYFADFGGLLIGENMQLEVSVFDGGAYYDGANIVSGVSQDQVVLRAIARHDFGARYRGKEISVITGVDWQ